MIRKFIVLVVGLVSMATVMVASSQTNPGAPSFVFAATPSTSGQWSAPIPWSYVGVHAMLLNTGKVLTWQSGTQSGIWDPVTGTFSNIPDIATNLLCAGETVLPDGRIIAVGGGGLDVHGVRTVNVFDPKTLLWSMFAQTNQITWYATTSIMPNGDVLRVGGVNGCNNCQTEAPSLYSVAGNSWRDLTGANTTIPMYPFTYVRPDGTVAVLGASEITSPLRILDTNAQTWRTTDNSNVDGGSSAMYDVGKVIKAGSASDSGNAPTASARTAYTTDLSQANPVWTSTGNMSNPRSFLNLTALPDGTVLATGGETTHDGENVNNAVLAAEVWNPNTGVWTTLASEQRPRLYHSTSLLLPDGTVFVSGGGADPGVPDEFSSEIFSPPYLFNGPRPTISSAPSQAIYGSQFVVQTPDAPSIVSASLIRAGATTHFFDESTRRVPVSFTSDSSSLTIQTPASGSIAPPGYYMLFIVNSAGVPSIAPMIQLASQPATPTPTPIPGTPTAIPTATSTPVPSTVLVGSNIIQSGRDTDSAGSAEALQYTASMSGTVGQLSAYIDSGNASSKISIGLYADSGGNPGALLTQGTITGPTAGMWNTVTVSPASVTAGQSYWLAILSPTGSGTVSFRDIASGGGATQTSAQSNLATLPASWSSGAHYANAPASMYASVAPGTPTPTPTATNTPTATDTPTVTPTATITPTATDTPIPTDTPFPTSTPTATQTPLATNTPTVTPTATNTLPPTSTPTGTPTPSLLVGDKTLEATSDDSSAGSAEAFQYTATTTGTATQLLAYMNTGNAATKIVLGLYTDNAGRPGTLLTQGSLTSPGAAKWISVPVTPVTVTSGVKYWIAILSPTGSGKVNFRDKNSGTSVSSQQSNLTTLPATWTNGITWSGSSSMSSYASP